MGRCGVRRLPRERLAFAHQLRGVAALCVVFIHYTVVYQRMRPMVGWVIAAPALEGEVPGIAMWALPRWFDAGAFGVALFFLISGFVIPFALADTTGLRFLAARAVRVYPVLWAALALDFAAVTASGASWGRTGPFTLWDYALNAALLNSSLGGVSVDLVSWTLCIEVKFYILMAVLRPLIVAKRIWPLVAVAGWAVAIAVAAPASQAAAEPMYLAYMLIGTAVHYHYRCAIGGRALGGLALLLGVAFALCWCNGPESAGWPAKPANYGTALLVFGAAYGSRQRLRPSALLDRVADVSYPLYLVHSVVGFAAMSALISGCGWSYPAAVGAAAVVALGLAAVLHAVVERPAIRAAHLIGAPGRSGGAPHRAVGATHGALPNGVPS